MDSIKIPVARQELGPPKKLPVIAAYLSLLLLSLAIPLLHERFTDRAIESQRPAEMLLPSHLLLLRWLGQISFLAPVGVFGCFATSFWREEFSRFTTICVIAICQCSFATLYAVYAAFLLGWWWLYG